MHHEPDEGCEQNTWDHGGGEGFITVDYGQWKGAGHRGRVGNTQRCAANCNKDTCPHACVPEGPLVQEDWVVLCQVSKKIGEEGWGKELQAWANWDT